MPVETASDRLAMLADWGEQCVVAGSSVRGLLADDYVETLDISGNRPVLLIRTADVTATYGAAVIVGSTSYTVAAIQPDSEGFTTLILSEA